MKTKIDLKFEEDVYKRYYPLVYTTCKRFLIDKCFLSDATQSVFLLYIKKEDQISSNLSSWFYWASVNICKVVNKDSKKHLEKSRPLDENLEITDENKSQEEFFLDLSGVLDKLPTKKRDMLLMRFYENKTYREIGDYFKCKEDSVRVMIDRTLLYLKNEVNRKEVLSSVVFAQFFGLESPAVAVSTPNQFILQNSLLQQSFIKGVQKMYLISKFKNALILCLCLLIPIGISVSVFNNEKVDHPIVNKSEEFKKMDKTKNVAVQSEARIQNSSNDQKVVDQTLRSPIAKEEKLQSNKDILGLEEEKINLEITLVDGEQNKLLTDCEVEFISNKGNAIFTKDNFKSDKSGKFIFSLNQPCGLNVMILTKAYAIHTGRVAMCFGKNEYIAKLYKGGVVEIRAINEENKVVDGLVRVENGGLLKLPIEFDDQRGVYVISNLPFGKQSLRFKADGYRQSSTYISEVGPKNITSIVVKLKPARILSFDLNIDPKPEFIYITNRNSIEKAPSIFKNKKNLYEYELEDKGLNSLMIFVDNYVPQKISLFEGIDFYKVNLVEGYKGFLQINNEKGEPIIGERVTYQPKDYSFSKFAVSDENGIAHLEGLSEKMQLQLITTHDNGYFDEFKAENREWAFNAKDQNTKKITLTKSFVVSGKIKFGEKLVNGAIVQLFRSDNKDRGTRISSQADGSYIFYINLLPRDKSYEYFIKASHPDFGAAISPIIKLESKNEKIDLTLSPEKSLTIKLNDSSGNPLPNKKITILNKDFFSYFSLNIMTNENGVYEFYNLAHGKYYFLIEDEKLMLNGEVIQIPAAETYILKAMPKYLKKIAVTTPGGGRFSGNLELKSGGLGAKCFFKSDDGNYYLAFNSEDEKIRSSIVFEALGYSIFELENYAQVKDIPQELNVELTEGENVKISVLADSNNRPIPNAMVDISKVISSNSYILNLMPTNEIGEINCSHLSGKLTISIKADNFATYKNEIDVSQTKELVVKLVKGGDLKGHLTYGKDVVGGSINLQPGNFNISFDNNGNFDVKNLPPNEYTLTVMQYLNSLIHVSGKPITKTISSKIKIENEKSLEINLDEVLKN